MVKRVRQIDRQTEKEKEGEGDREKEREGAGGKSVYAPILNGQFNQNEIHFKWEIEGNTGD